MLKPSNKTISRKGDIRVQKDMLAKILATENIRIIHSAKAKTARFDTKNRVLTLPIYASADLDVLDMLTGHEVGHALYTPVVSPEQVGADLDARLNSHLPQDSASKAKRVKALGTFANVTEDARIEKMIKNRYPGLRQPFIRAYQKMEGAGMFGTGGLNQINSLPLIDRLNMHFKLGSSYGVRFTKDEQPILDQVARATTFQDAMDAAAAAYRYCQDHNTQDIDWDAEDNGDGESDDSGSDGDEENDSNKSNKGGNKSSSSSKKKKNDAADSSEDGEDSDSGDDSNGKKGSSSSSQNDDDGDGTEGDDADGDSAGDQKGDDSGTDQQDGGSDGDQEGGDKSDKSADKSGSSSKSDKSGDASSKNGGDKSPKKSPSKKSGGSAGHGTGGNVPEASSTVTKWESDVEKLVDKNAKDVVYCNLPVDAPIDNYIHDYKAVLKDFDKIVTTGEATEIKAFRKENSPIIGYMVKEFEMKKAADQHNRSRISKTGMIDVNRLHAYQITEDIFARARILPGAKNHGLIMFIDWSGSMDDHIPGTIDQLMNLVLFCRQIRVPFEVYAFSNEGGAMRKVKSGGATNDLYKDGDLIPNVALINLISSRASSMDFNKSLQVLLRMKDAYKRGGRSNLPNGYATSGTPLNDAIILAPTIVKRFKEKNRLQIVNTVWLTDGDSGGHCYYKNGSQVSNYLYGGEFVYRDPVSRYEYSSKDADGGGGTTLGQTTMLFNLVKHRLGVNNIGFYITDSVAETVKHKVRDGATAKKIMEDFNTKKFANIQNAGYDDYYVIPGSSSLNTSGGTSQNASAKKMNRVVLSRFIDKIAT